MTKINTPAIDTSIPDFLKRETNARGVTLSAGVATLTPAPKAATVTAAKTEPKVTKVAPGVTAKSIAKAAAKAAKPAKVVKAKAPKAAKLPKATKVTKAPAVGPDGQPLEKVSRSIVPMKFKARYAKNNGVCGDDVSLELKAATTTRNADKREVLDVAALWAIAKANSIDVSKYVDLNNGQKRMNVGNKLRGKLANGDDVVIGKRKFKAEDFTPRA